MKQRTCCGVGPQVWKVLLQAREQRHVRAHWGYQGGGQVMDLGPQLEHALGVRAPAGSQIRSQTKAATVT